MPLKERSPKRLLASAYRVIGKHMADSLSGGEAAFGCFRFSIQAAG